MTIKIISVMLAVMMMFIPVGSKGLEKSKVYILSAGDKMATVGGNSVRLSFAPVVSTNKVYDLLPDEERFVISIRDFISLTGSSLNYNAQEKSVEFVICGKSVKMFVGINVAYVDGVSKDIEIGLLIESGVTYVPVMTIAQLSGGSATYDSTKKQMTAEFPLCLFIAPEDTVINTFAKVDTIDKTSGKMMVIDPQTKVMEIDIPANASDIKPGDSVRLIVKSTGDGWKTYHFSKEAFEFGRGYLTILPNKNTLVTNGSSISLSYGFKWIEGKPYIGISDLALTLGGLSYPGNMAINQVKIFGNGKIYIFTIGKDTWFDQLDKDQKTVTMDGKTLISGGVVIVPASSIQTIFGGKMSISEDLTRIDFNLDSMPSFKSQKSYSMRLDKIDCANNLIKANDYELGAVDVAVIDNRKLSCSQLVEGGYYTAVCEKVTDRDGNTKLFATACLKSNGYIFTFKDKPKLTTGKIVSIVDEQMARVLFDGDKEPTLINLYNTELYKEGMCLKGLFGIDYKGDARLNSSSVIDCKDGASCQCISLVLSKKDGVIQGLDDSGKLWRINFPNVPWDLASKLEDGQRYKVRGYQRGVVLDAIDFLRTDQVDYMDKKISLTLDEKDKSYSLSFAFRFGNMVYTSLSLFNLMPLTYLPPQIGYIDEFGNIIEMTIGSKAFKLNGKQMELTTEPLYIGYSMFIDTADLPKITPSKVVSQEGDTLNLRLFYRNLTQPISNFRFCANIKMVEANKFTATAVDEFGRPVNILFLDGNDTSILKPGSCYNFISKNYGWTDFVVFNTPTPADCPCGGGQTQHEVILGKIKSVDCINREVVVTDKLERSFKCILPETSKDCELLAAGQNVGIEAEMFEGKYKIIYKWHFNKMPEPLIKKVTLRVGEKTATVENEKDLYIGYPLKMIDGQPCVSKYAISKLFPSSVLCVQMGNRLKISIWGHVLNFWIGQNEAIIDGLVTKIPVAMTYAEGQTVVPLQTLLNTIGSYCTVSEDSKTMTAMISYCPIPLEATTSISQEPFDRIMSVSGVEMVGGSLDMFYRIRVSDLSQLKGIEQGSCVKAVYRSFWLFDRLEMFAQSIEPIECPQP